jgi:DNA-binding transcriptional MerR regulator
MTKYSIEQFSQITGISKFVLRTWENRYGYLKAERTDTKIRFYTDELLVRALNTNYVLENGIKISAVSKMSDADLAAKVEEIKMSANQNSSEQYYITKFIESALEYDSALFHQIYKDGVDEFGSVEFYKNVLLPTFSKIGIFWLTNRIAPSQEHFLSELIRQKILSAVDEYSDKTEFKSSWLLFLPENEFHDIGLLFAKFLLVFYNCEVIYLGTNVPYGSLQQITQKKKVENILFFSVSNQSKSNLNFTIQYLERIFDNSKIYLVCNSLDNDLLVKDYKVNILNNLDDLIKIIK